MVEASAWLGSGRKESGLAEATRRLRASDAAGGGATAPPPPATAAQIAASAETSTDTIKRAKVVATKGSEAVKKAVLAGEVTVRAAAAVADLPKGDVPRGTAPKGGYL